MSTRGARGAATLPLAILGLLALLLATPGAAVEPREFASALEERRYRDLIEELRCLVCQNQNLADSNADLARDLRDEVHAMLRAGRSDQEILAFMVDRYGDFVLYRPPLKPATALLWFGPFVLAAAALAWLVVQVRRRRPARGGDAAREDAPLDEAERRRAAALLGRGGDDRA